MLKRMMLSTAALLIALTAVVAAADPPFEAALTGRWVPQYTLGVVEVRAKYDGERTIVKMYNHIQNEESNWTYAEGRVIDMETTDVMVYVQRGKREMGSATARIHLENADHPTLRFTDTTIPSNSIAAFAPGRQWHRFAAGTLCRTTRLSQEGARRPLPAFPLRNNSSRGGKPLNVSRVHVVFMQHLDIGYTDYAWCVISHYLFVVLPGAALTSSQMPSYIYTTHAWLLYLLFECESLLPWVRPPPGISFVCPGPQVVSLVGDAIRRGGITWHAFPFDGFNELLGAQLFDYGFDFPEWLHNKFFNGSTRIRPKTMAQVDIPGVYRAQIPTLLKRGVTSLYIGQNSWPGWCGPLPAMPRLFMWDIPTSALRQKEKGTPGGPLLVLTHPRGYSGLEFEDAIIDEPSGSALLVHCSLENRPPYTPQDIDAYLAHVADEFPSKARVFPSTFDAFVADVKGVGWPRKDIILFDQDIGDSWVRAIPSDPVKTKRFLELRRAFETCVSAKGCAHFDNSTMRTVLFLMTGAEHNFGLPLQASDWESTVLSYAEKRDMVEAAARSLAPFMERRVSASGASKAEASPSRGGDKNFSFQCDFNGTVALIDFSNATGAITKLVLVKRSSGAAVTVAAAENRLLDIVYAVHSTYYPLADNGWGDASPDHLVQQSGPEDVTVRAVGGCAFVVDSAINQSYFDNSIMRHTTPTINVSAMMQVRVDVAFTMRKAGLHMEAAVTVRNKLMSDVSYLYQSWSNHFCYGDAMHVGFNPVTEAAWRTDSSASSIPDPWRISALGVAYSPNNFAAYGTCNYHVADSVSVTLESSQRGRQGTVFQCTSVDAPLALFGWNSATWVSNVTDPPTSCRPLLETGVWFNLWNEWNGNWVAGFPWNESDFSEGGLTFRFVADISPV